MARVPRRPIRTPGDDYIPPTTGPGATPLPAAPGPTVPGNVRWQDYLIQFVGLPPDLVAQIEAIFTQNTDPSRAALIAVGVIRGSDWYKVRYKGIGAGIAKGMFGDETGYNAYVNQVQQSFRRYYGRDASADEIEGFLNQGLSAQTIEQQGQGKAYVDANRADLQYYAGAFAEGQLSDEQLKALGEQEVGLGSNLGATIQSKVQQAVRKAQRVFEGQLATPNQSLGSQGLYSPSLGRQNRDLAA